MSGYPKPKRSVLAHVSEVKAMVKKKNSVEPYDPDDPPGKIVGVVLDFKVREKHTHLRYRAIVRWDPMPAGQCAADLHQYIIQMRPCDEDGDEIEAGRRKFGTYTVEKASDLDVNLLTFEFHDVEHPKEWHYKARVRAVDTEGNKGEWSDWTDPLLPFDEANPLPPPPDTPVLVFDLNEKDRQEPRHRAIVRFPELGPWDIPPTQTAERFDTTLDGAIGSGATDIKVTDISGFMQPLSTKQPLGASLRPGKKSTLEVITYNDRDVPNKKLLGVKRGQDGTAAAPHGNGSAIRQSKGDQQDKINDLDRYVIQLRRCEVDSGGAFIDWVVDDDGKYVQRTANEDWSQENDDEDDLVKHVFPNVRWRHYWRARARTVDRYNRRGEWSDWSNVGSPSDDTPPPQPNSVSVNVDNNRVTVECVLPTDPDDPEVPHIDIAYCQYQISTSNTFATITKQDMYVVGEKKNFKVKKASVQYYGRVRTVDASGNKSAWATSNANKQRPPQPDYTTFAITFDDNDEDKGSKLRAICTFTYNEALYDEDHIDKYILEAIITATSSYVGNEHRRRQVIDISGDTAETDANDPQSITFKGVPRHKWIRFRLRAVDKNNRKSPWSLWSSSYQITDATAPPGPSSVTITSDVKGVLVDWEPPLDADDSESDSTNSKVADKRIHSYQVEVHGNSGFTNRLKRDRHVVQTKRRFPGLTEGGTYYARVRSISSTGTKSGWVTSTGVVTAPVVDRPAMVANSVDSTIIDTGAVGSSEIGDDAVGTPELNDDGSTVGVGTWKNGTSGTYIEIASADGNTIRMFQSGITNRGHLQTSGDTIALRAPYNSAPEINYLIMESSPNSIFYVADELIRSATQRGCAGIHVPGGQVGANEKHGIGYTWGGATKTDSTPGSVSYTTVGTDQNVKAGSPSYEDLNTRGFLFVCTADVAATPLHCTRQYAA
jgi:hypothetical protein